MARRAEDFLDAESFLDAGSTSQIAAPSSRQSAESFLDAEAFLDAAPSSSPGRARMASSQFARGFGAVATSIPKYAAIASQGNREALLEAFDAIDSDASKGAPRDVSVFDQPLLIQYRRASPEERAQLRSDAEDRVSDPRGTSLYRSGQAAQQAIEAWFPTNPEYAEEWLASKIPQGLGSATGFLSLGLLGRLAGASAGATAATGGAALGGTDQFESALAEGSTLEDAITSSNWGAAVGLSEAIPIARLIDRVDKGTGGSLKRLIASTLAQGTEEAAQETFQTIMDNLIASDLVGYDPERGTFTGTGDAAGVGFSVGGLMNFIGQIVVGRRAPRAGRPDEAATSAPRERTADEIIAFAENRIRELEGGDTATQEEADFLRAHLSEPELLAAAYGERLVPGSQPTRAPVQPVSQADIDSPIPTPMIAEGRQVVSESLEAARDGRLPAAQEPTDATTQQAQEQRPEPEVQAQEEALEPRAQAERTDEQPRPVLEQTAEPTTAEAFLDEEPTAELPQPDFADQGTPLAVEEETDVPGIRDDRGGSAVTGQEEMAGQSQRGTPPAAVAARGEREAPPAAPETGVPDRLPAADQAADAEPALERRYEDLLGRAVRRFQMEEQGQGILDDLEASETSPRTVAERFWRETYPQLNAETQRRFTRYVERLSGFKPGDAVGQTAQGEPIVAETALDLADFVNEDLAGQAEHLEGTERGYVAMMQWANQQRESAAAEEQQPVAGAIEAPAPAETKEIPEKSRAAVSERQADARPSRDARAGAAMNRAALEEIAALTGPIAEQSKRAIDQLDRGESAAAFKTVRGMQSMSEGTAKRRITQIIRDADAAAATTEAAPRETAQERGRQDEVSRLRTQDGDREPVAPQESSQRLAAGSESARSRVQAPPIFQVLDNLLDRNRVTLSGRDPANLIEGQSTASEGSLESVLRDVEFLRNVIGSDTFSEQGFSGLDVETQRLVQAHVLSLARDEEIAGRVIELIPVSMMNDLVGPELSIQHIRSNPAVIEDSIASNLRSGIAPRGDVSDTLVVASTLAGAEKISGRVGSDLIGPALNSFLADRTVDGNHRTDNTRRDRDVPSQNTARETDTGVEMFSLDESDNSQTAGDLRVSSRFSQEWQQKRGEVAAELRRELDRIGLRRLTLRLPDSMDVIDGRQQRVGGISGRYKPGLIDVALAPERDYGRTLRHEAIHALKDLGLFRNAEWRALERAAQADTDRMAEVRDRYAPQNLTEDQLIEERVADMYADWSADRMQAGGFVRTAFERIKAFLEALGNALRGNGFQTAADVVERIQAGEVGGRGARADVAPGAAEFNRWFGDSKVVDEAGQPLVVYHGTDRTFSEFKKTKIGKKNILPLGFFFSEDPSTASVYATLDVKRGPGNTFSPSKLLDRLGVTGFAPQVMPVYLSIQNPYLIGPDSGPVHLRAIQRAGHDGLKMTRERGGTTWVAFEPTQIKSATGNRGTFDPTNPDIRYSLEAGGFRPEIARRIQRGEAVAAAAARVPPPSEPDPKQAFSDGFSDVPQTVLDFVRQKLQDRFIDLKRVQESTGRVPDEMDAYLGEELYHGRAEAAIEEARETSMKPLLDAIRDADLAIEQAGEYLYARHAKERNRRIAEINPRFAEGGGSGMTDAEADEILSRYQGNAAVERIGELVDGITAKHRALLLSSGLEKPGAIEAWERMYEHYVPLKGRGDIDDDGRISPSRGRGFDVRGRTKAATGRKSMARNIVANVLAQYETDIIRSQKAEVGRSLLRFVEAHPDSTLWEVDRVEYAGKVNPRTGLVEYRPDQRYQLADNVLVVKVDGVDHHITFHGERGKRIASSMKNLGAANAGGAIRAFAAVNRVLSAVNTSLNPEFVVSNLARDLQTAGINLAGTEADAVKGRILKDVPRAWRGIRRAQKGKNDSEWSQYFDEFLAAGAKVGWIDAHNDVNRLQSQLEREIRAHQRKAHDPRRLVRLIGEFVEAENIAVENSVRLSAFVHGRRIGMSEARAASLAKNLTVNFNRKGEYGVLMNSLYLFYNASVQGNIRMFQALRSPKVRKIAGGIVVFATMLDILNRTVGGDDEDDVPLYDKIPPWIKERNLIIMNPSAEDGYFKVPLPWGYNVFHVLGQQVGEAASSAMGLKPDYRPVDSALTLLSAIAGAFNPLGSDASIGQFLSPTITDPIVSLEGNRDWAGRPIRPGENPFEQAPTPDSQKFWNSTGEIPRWISERLNALTGGSEVRPGIVDISPTTFDYLFEFATGGAGRFISNTVDAPLKQIVEGEVETYRIPFVRQVYGDIGSRATQDRFYENLEQVYYAEQELELAQENRDIRAQQDIRRTQRVYLGARLRAQAVERRLRQLRQQRNSIRAQDTPESIKRPRLRRIEERMEREMLAFNRYIRQRQQ